MSASEDNAKESNKSGVGPGATKRRNSFWGNAEVPLAGILAALRIVVGTPLNRWCSGLILVGAGLVGGLHWLVQLVIALLDLCSGVSVCTDNPPNQNVAQYVGISLITTGILTWVIVNVCRHRRKTNDAKKAFDNDLSKLKTHLRAIADAYDNRKTVDAKFLLEKRLEVCKLAQATIDRDTSTKTLLENELLRRVANGQIDAAATSANPFFEISPKNLRDLANQIDQESEK